MKKLAIGILSSALILGACSNHSENGDSDNKSSSTNNSTTKNQSNNKTNDNKKNYKEVPISDIFNDGKEHLVYKFKEKMTVSENDAIEEIKNDPIEELKAEYDFESIYNIKDNKGFEYVFDPEYQDGVPSSITLEKLSKYSLEENKNKFHKLQEINLKEYTDRYDDIEPIQLHNEPKEIEKVFYTKGNKAISENFNIAMFYLGDDGNVLDEKNKKVWHLRENNYVFNDNAFPNNKMVSVEPFTINGKTYSGIATPTLDGNTKEVVGYEELVITEVPKNTKIVMDKDISEGKEEKYEDTDNGKREQKQEEKEFDNL